MPPLMNLESRTNRTRLLAAIGATLVGLAVVAFVFDLGPFADEELTPAQFLARGDEICAQAHDEFLDLQDSTPRTAADAEAQVQGLIEIAEEEREALAELDAPSSLSAKVGRYLDDRDAGIALLRKGLSAARADDSAAYEAAQAELASQQAERHRAARRVGFSECSEPLVSDEELERQAQPPSGG
jgi:hypothetical protein